MSRHLFKDPTVQNVAWLSLLAFIIALQGLILLVFIYHFIPLEMAPITHGVPQKMLQLFKPKRDFIFYRAFIVGAILFQVGLMYFYRARIYSSNFVSQVRALVVAASVCVGVQIFAVFKILQYQDPPWAWGIFYFGLVAMVGGAIFWPELFRATQRSQNQLQKQLPPWVLWIFDGGVIVFLFLVIWIPDPQKAINLIGLYNPKLHWDQWVMSEAFLNPGVPVLMKTLGQLVGGISYTHLITIFTMIAVVYYSIFYVLMRSWLNSRAWAVVAVVAAVKIQMFNAGVVPIIWAFPQYSVLRHLCDLAVFACLWFYIDKRKKVYLWLAAVAAGFALAYVVDTGIYVLAAVYALIAVCLCSVEERNDLCPHLGQWRKILGLVLLPWVVMVIVLACWYGRSSMHMDYWIQLLSQINSYAQGVGSLSILSCLRERNFFAFFAAFAVGFVYIAGLLAGAYWFMTRSHPETSDEEPRLRIDDINQGETTKRSQTTTVRRNDVEEWHQDKPNSVAGFGMASKQLQRERILVIPLAVYGIGTYIHFLWHAGMNLYYMVPLPLIGLLCFFAQQLAKMCKAQTQNVIKCTVLVLTCIGLLTNVIFTYYPHVFNRAPFDGKKIVNEQ